MSESKSWWHDSMLASFPACARAEVPSPVSPMWWVIFRVKLAGLESLGYQSTPVSEGISRGLTKRESLTSPSQELEAQVEYKQTRGKGRKASIHPLTTPCLLPALFCCELLCLPCLSQSSRLTPLELWAKIGPSFHSVFFQSFFFITVIIKNNQYN